MVEAHPLSDIFNTEQRIELEGKLAIERRQRHDEGNPMPVEEYNARIEEIHAQYPIYDRLFEKEYRAQALMSTGAEREDRANREIARRNAVAGAVERVEKGAAKAAEVLKVYSQLEAVYPSWSKKKLYIETGEACGRSADHVARIVTQCREDK